MLFLLYESNTALTLMSFIWY